MLCENVLWQVVKSLPCVSDMTSEPAARLTRQLWLISSTNQQTLTTHSSLILTPVILICWRSKWISGQNKRSGITTYVVKQSHAHPNSKISKTQHFNQCWRPLSCKLGGYSQYPKQIIFIRFPKLCHWFVKLWMIMKLSA